MPVRSSFNNQLLPANARAADVASKAIQEILPVQQSRNYDAHRVQGFPAILYNQLTQGVKCSCQTTDKKLGARLDLDGKANPGLINELLTGAMTFSVTPYGSSPMPRDDPFDTEVSRLAPKNKHQGVFDIVGKEVNGAPTNIEFEDVFGDNGPLQNLTMDDIAGDYDATNLGSTDAACAVCFGTSFVGGYSPFHANRIVRTVADVDLINSEINLLARPWSATSEGFSFVTSLPYGAIGLDMFRVLNNDKPLGAKFTIDGQPVTELTLVARCDGKPHLIAVVFNKPTVWTHIEIQFILSAEHAFFEFPRLSKSSDTNLLEKTEPFQISISSNVPILQVEDLIVDSTYGKALIVQTCNPWNTRNRDILGWECMVRPVQPMELYNILPRRGRIKTKPPTPLMAHDNQSGTYRT